MEMTPRSPGSGIYPATPDYLHAMEVRGASRLLFVSGTMGLDPSGRAPDSLRDQLSLAWSNIGRILEEAGMTTHNIVRATSYLRDPLFAGANQAARVRALGGRCIPTTVIVVQTLMTEWLVEIEVIAAA